MPPIPININAPIKPTGVTPQTSSPDEQAQKPPPTRTIPASVPATTTVDPSLPPPPQPGARPIPPTATAHPTSSISASSDPPPPQPVGGPTRTIAEVHTTTITQPCVPPPQLSIPAPTANAAPTRSTAPSTSGNPSIPAPGPTFVDLGPTNADADADAPQRHSIEHPPHYQQNPYAADGTASQRAVLEDAAARAREEEQGTGVMGVLKGVGEKLAKAEEGVWGWVRKG